MQTTTLTVIVGTLLGVGALQGAQITTAGLGLGRTDVSMIIDGSSKTDQNAVQIYLKKNGIDFTAFCVDFFTGISTKNVTYNTTTVLPSSLTPNGMRAAWAFENYRTWANTNDRVAALQVALWDIVHDGGDGLSAGQGRIALAASESALSTMAMAIVTASVGQSSNNATILYNFTVTTGAKRQTLITTADAYTPNPEPQTMALMGLGLTGLWWGRRRRGGE